MHKTSRSDRIAKRNQKKADRRAKRIAHRSGRSRFKGSLYDPYDDFVFYIYMDIMIEATISVLYVVGDLFMLVADALSNSDFSD